MRVWFRSKGKLYLRLENGEGKTLGHMPCPWVGHGNLSRGRGQQWRSSCETGRAVQLTLWITELGAASLHLACCHHLDLSVCPAPPHTVLGWYSCFAPGTLVWSARGKASAQGALGTSPPWIRAKEKKKGENLCYYPDSIFISWELFAGNKIFLRTTTVVVFKLLGVSQLRSTS